jgi:acyl dehydratase
VQAGARRADAISSRRTDVTGGDPDKLLAFYGMDRVRFVKPVFIGDTIHLTGEVKAIEPKDDGNAASSRFTRRYATSATRRSRRSTSASLSKPAATTSSAAALHLTP